MFELKKTVRNQVKLKILLSGASGSGKTMSALKLAKGMCGEWGKIAVIDTENSSASLYSDLGSFYHLNFEPPYSPNRYIEAIKFAESQKDIDVIIIDSISHEWDGKGGCLEMVSNFGGKFQDWSKVTPLHNQFIEAIKQCKKHLILTARTKTEYDMSKNDSGKTRVQKVGTKNVQRDGFDYELTMGFRINENHYAETDKDRTNLFAGKPPVLIDETTGELIREWNLTGEKFFTVDDVIDEIKKVSDDPIKSREIWNGLNISTKKQYKQAEIKSFIEKVKNEASTKARVGESEKTETAKTFEEDFNAKF